MSIFHLSNIPRYVIFYSAYVPPSKYFTVSMLHSVIECSPVSMFYTLLCKYSTVPIFLCPCVLPSEYPPASMLHHVNIPLYLHSTALVFFPPSAILFPTHTERSTSPSGTGIPDTMWLTGGVAMMTPAQSRSGKSS